MNNSYKIAPILSPKEDCGLIEDGFTFEEKPNSHKMFLQTIIEIV